MAKYTFSGGKVEVEEGVYLPPLRKDKRWARVGVVLIIPPRPETRPQTKSTERTDKENARDKQQ